MNERPEPPEVRGGFAAYDERAQAHIDALRGEIGALTGKLTAAEHRIRVLEAQAADAKRRYDRLSRRRAVRLALRAAGALRPMLRPAVRLARRVLRRRAKPVRPPTPAVPRIPSRTRDEVVATLRAQRPERGPESGPRVSILVLTRNGREHVERLFSGLRDRTAYRSFEVVVVDNGSTDGTDEVLGRDWGFPVRAIRNETNSTFSGGNNQAFAAANGELVLLCNNDVDPVNEGWLGAMVQTLTASDRVGAVGALLVYPERPPDLDLQGDTTFQDFSIQHRGIAFGWTEGAVRARNLGGGEDPLLPEHARDRDIPAVTAACMLLRADTYRALGGLTEGYVYGTEDVDLCVKIRAAGMRSVLCGRAALFHHEFGTQSAVDRETKRRNRIGNRALFAERWGPTLARSLRLEQVLGGGAWTDRQARTIAITLTRDDPDAGFGDWYTAHELGDALAAQGWTVRYAERYQDNWYRLPDDVGVVLVLLEAYDVRRAPAGAYRVAWIRNWLDRWLALEWLDDFDLVLTSSTLAAEVVRRETRHHAAVLPLATNPTRFQPLGPSDEFACDYTFTGNNWGRGRSLLDLLEVHEGERFRMYGKGWDDEPKAAPYWGGHVDYWRLPELYSSARIVLDDTPAPTRPYGLLNLRPFEALACGALPITDNTIGAQEMFGGALPTYTNGEELRAQLDRYLGDEELRVRTVESLRARVVSEHTYERRAGDLAATLRAELEKPRVALKIGPPTREVMEQWGDTHFARGFARSLRRLGFQTDIHILPEWDLPQNQDADVVVHLRGLKTYTPKAAHLNALWIISHPELVVPEECEMFDVVFVASSAFAEELRGKVRVPVHVLHQATDVERFTPADPDPSLHAEVLFVGNSRGQRRDAVEWAIQAGAPLAIYGTMWDRFVPDHYVRATYFPNERLNALYGSADILLNDHWPDMRTQGFVSNRIFDALACGAFVLSDACEGLEELFGDAVATFRDGADLAAQIERFRADPAERRRRAERGMAIVRRDHSFDARAGQFLDVIGERLRDRPLTVEAKAAGSAGAPPPAR